MSLDKVMMPVPDPHPDVFDREWPLRVADIDATARTPGFTSGGGATTPCVSVARLRFWD